MTKVTSCIYDVMCFGKDQNTQRYQDLADLYLSAVDYASLYNFFVTTFRDLPCTQFGKEKSNTHEIFIEHTVLGARTSLLYVAHNAHSQIGVPDKSRELK